MDYPLVIKKVSGLGTVAHESIHAATFIYYTIKNYVGNQKLLSEIFKWTLHELTVVQNNDCVGCFKHRNWGRFTEQANIYCCFAGMLGGWMMIGHKSIDEWSDHYNSEMLLLKSMIKDLRSNDFIETKYENMGAKGDLINSCVADYNDRLRYINEILSLLQDSNVFKELLTECMVQLQNKDTLYQDDLVNLAEKYKERIVCETFKDKRFSITLSDNGKANYRYY